MNDQTPLRQPSLHTGPGAPMLLRMTFRWPRLSHPEPAVAASARRLINAS